MNWALIGAGFLSLMASMIHGGVGDRIIRRIDGSSLPGNPFAGLSTMLLIRVTWHFVTIAFFVLGGALIAVGVRPDTAAATGVAYVAGAAFVCWSIFAFIAGLRSSGMRALKSHPAPIIFLLTVFLIFWGVLEL